MTKTVMGICLFVFASFAHATDTMGYLGLGVGQADIDDVVDPIPGVSISQDTEGDMFRLYGGRQINDNFAFEVGWIDFGNYGADLQGFGITETLDADAEAFFLNAVLSTPVNDVASLYFKAGLYSWSVDLDDVATDGVTTVVARDSLDGNDTFFGIGAMFNLQEIPFSLRVGYERYNDIGDDKDSTGEDVDVMSLDVLLTF